MVFTVLGIDPGLTRMGWGSIVVNGDEMELGLCGVITHSRDTAELYNSYLNNGIKLVADKFPTVLSLVEPTFISAETVPAGRLGSRSELVVAAITVAKVVAYQFGVPWIDVAANTAKKELTGDGKATKASVKNAVTEYFPILAQKHAAARQQQKDTGQKVIGLPQDLYDAIALSIAGAKLHGELYK